MRLQVAIDRHSLPTVNIIFNTSSAVDRIRTISDFLNALNDIVPLESADGEWGLEEYAVEVAATADQEKVYECLHFQLVKDVFREDDEVVVRGLTTEEIRQRRQGGRLQIAGDGRHLYDGVAWGRRYRPMAYRPDVIIPPRKKRRLLQNEYDLEEGVQDELLELEHPLYEKQVGTIINGEDEAEYDEDEDGDEDYDLEDEFRDGDSISDFDVEDDVDAKGASSTDGKPLQITATAEFEDADQDSSEEGSHTGLLEDNEIALLLEEAANNDVEDSDGLFGARGTVGLRKRKRVLDDTQHVTFEGFPSPANRDENAIKHSIGPYPVEARPERLRQTTGEVLNGDNNDTSSSDSSDSNSTSSSDQGSDTTSDSNDFEDDSETDSDSGDDTSSSASESVSEVSNQENRSRKSQDLNMDKVSSDNLNAKELGVKQKPSSDNPPGTGSSRTRKNNDRAKRRKRLANLKASGILPPDADFNALREHDNGLKSLGKVHEIPRVQPHHSEPNFSDLEKKREEILARINGISTEARSSPLEDIVAKTHEQHDSVTQDAVDVQGQMVNDEVNESGADSMTKGALEDGTLNKRAKLDIESSRRMLFSSLGLRNPKTKAAEDALRTKLTESVRKLETKRVQDLEPHVLDEVMKDDSWMRKLIVSAVECVDEGRTLSAPPFPFKQQWDRQTSNLRRQYNEHINQAQDGSLNYDEIDTDQSTAKQHVDAVNAVNAVHDPSTFTDIELDKYSYTEDVKVLPEFQMQDVQKGAIIAYKELHMNNRFEPTESSYRVARIVGDSGDRITVLLSTKNRREMTEQARYNDEGERIYHGLELVEESDDVDNGTRELAFANMIEAKLLKAGPVQVSASAPNFTDDPNLVDQDSMVVPESAQAHIEHPGDISKDVAIGSYQRNEITIMMTDAGVHSTLDDQLFQPIPSSKAEKKLTARSGPEQNMQKDTELLDSSQPDITKVVAPSSGRWDSSFVGTDESNFSSSPHINGASSPINSERSPPTVSMIEIVNYPHMSQIDLGGSGPSASANSSSYQDAQKTSPDGKRLSASQSNVNLGADIDTQESTDSTKYTDAARHKGDGVNGDDDKIEMSPDDRGEPISDDNSDSDGLPSVRALAASLKTSRSVAKPGPISPPPLQKNAPQSNKSRLTVVENRSSQDPPLVQDSVLVKMSQSSQNNDRLNQIPLQKDGGIVDLTVSSDPAAMDNETVASQSTPPTRSSQRISKAKQDSSSPAAKMMRSALAGIGSRRNLNPRKRSLI